GPHADDGQLLSRAGNGPRPHLLHGGSSCPRGHGGETQKAQQLPSRRHPASIASSLRASVRLFHSHRTQSAMAAEETATTPSPSACSPDDIHAVAMSPPRYTTVSMKLFDLYRSSRFTSVKRISRAGLSIP